MLPSDKYGEKQAENERKRVSAEIAAMTDDEKAKLVKLNRNLEKWQNTPDSAEDIAKLPKLPLTEISKEPVEYLTRETFEKSIKILRHPVREKEITVMTLYFDVNDFTIDELKQLIILDRLIAELPTERSSGFELQKKIVGTLGNLSTDIIPMGKDTSPESCKVFFTVKTRFLSRNTNEALNLIAELLTETEYDHSELVSRQLRQDEEELKQDIISEGHRFSVRRATANMSAESAIIELINGYEAYQTFHSVNKLSDDAFSKLLSQLRPLAKRVFCKSRLTVSIGSAGNTDISLLTDRLPAGTSSDMENMKFSLNIPKNNCIVVPTATSYSGAVLSRKITDKPEWSVASTIISYEYLWNEVRVKGGAYGSGCNVNNMNEACFHSYCDPSPLNSIGIYERSAEFLTEYCSNDPDITPYIISTIASGEPLVSDAEYLAAADGMYFRDITQDSRRKLRGEILDMTADRLADICSDLKKEMYCCVVGSKDTTDDVIKNINDRTFNVESVY